MSKTKHSHIPSRGRQITAALSLLFATAVWGASFLLIKLTIATVDVYYFLFLRFSLASLVMFAVFHRQILGTDVKTLKASLKLGALLLATYASQTEGLKITSAANSALITCLYMVLVPPFSFLYSGQEIKSPVMAGIVMAFSGMFMLTYLGLTGPNLGDAITLICAAALAWHIILTGKYTHAHKLIPLVFFQLFLTAGICGIVAAFKGGFATKIPSIGIFTIIFTALFATGMAFIIQTAAQRTVPPARAGVILSMEAVFGAAFAWGLGTESPTLASFTGAFLMVAGMVISELGPSRKKSIEVPS